MIGTYFTETEARAKVGKKIRTNHEFSGVPAGTEGVVLRYYDYGGTDYGLDIQWDLPEQKLCGSFIPLIDGFSKDEYEHFLEEIG